MICVAVVDGYVTVTDPAPADPSLCDLVILSGHQLPWWSLDTVQASELLAAIGVLWGFAFVCRSFIRQIIYSR